jgi:hypothetical protein
MSFKERNLYQGFIGQTLSLTDPDQWAKLGAIFAGLERTLNRCPRPYEIVSAYLSN